MICRLVLAFALVLVSWRSARAAELSLSEPSACAIGDELSQRVERALGQPLALAADVRFTIRVLREGGGYAARMLLRSPGAGGASKQRAFQEPTCEELTEVLAMAMVLALGSGSSEASDPPAPEGEETVATSSLGESSLHDERSLGAAAPPHEPHDRGGGARWGVRGALVLDAGALPAPAFGALLGGSLGWKQLEVRLLGTYLLPRVAPLEASGAASSGGEIELLTGGVLGCAPRLLTFGSTQLGSCAGAELGWLWGNGTGLSVARGGGGPWWAARADVGARWGLGPPWLALDVQVGLLFPLQRHRFTIGDGSAAQLVHQPSAVVGRLSVGVSVELD